MRIIYLISHCLGALSGMRPILCPLVVIHTFNDVFNVKSQINSYINMVYYRQAFIYMNSLYIQKLMQTDILGQVSHAVC